MIKKSLSGLSGKGFFILSEILILLSYLLPLISHFSLLLPVLNLMKVNPINVAEIQ